MGAVVVEKLEIDQEEDPQSLLIAIQPLQSPEQKPYVRKATHTAYG